MPLPPAPDIYAERAAVPAPGHLSRLSWLLRRRRPRLYGAPMHSVDPTTESMIRSVLAYAENRLRLNPVPLDRGSRDPAELEAALKGLLGREPHNPD